MVEDFKPVVIQQDTTPEQEAERAQWAKEKPAQDKLFIEEIRKQQYRDISDPIFFQYQRGEKTKQEWLDAVATINDANPYPAQVK